MRKRYPELTANLAVEPAARVVRGRFRSAARTPRRSRSTVQEPKLAGVGAGAGTGKETSQRILQIARVIQIVFLIAVVILLAASTILIANTIRLSIFARRREIEVMKLVGATNWFVRGPFMLEGLLTGLAGLGRRGAPALRRQGDRASRDPRAHPGRPDVQALGVRVDGGDPHRGRARRRRARLGPDAAPLPAGLERWPRPGQAKWRLLRLLSTLRCADAAAARPTRRPAEAAEPLRRARRRPAHAVQAAERRIDDLAARRGACAPESRRRPPRARRTPARRTHALEVLAEQGRGVYAGPLRMLAQEAHRRLGERIGPRTSGSSPARSASTSARRSSARTVEMAPQAGERARARRGAVGRRPRARARPGRGCCSRASTATSSCSARSTRSRSCSARSPSSSSRSSSASSRSSSSASGRSGRSTPGTVVVAFSRKAVLALAGEVNRLHPGRVAVLYGAMPLASRREEIDRFLSGAADVCVATDVLGHGVNLPCETLLFAETTKFDGEERRDLLPWELAQIAGRAGRFGLVERGHVGVLAGLGWASRRPRDRRVGARAARPAARRPRRVPHRRRGADPAAALRPRRRRSARTSTPRSSPGTASRLREWAFESWLAVESLQPLRLRLAAVQRRLAERGRRLSLEDTWKLVNAPVDEDDARAARDARARGRRRPRRSGRSSPSCSTPARLRDASLEDAEQAGREASILRWFALQYPDVGGVTIERAAALEEAAAERVVARLRVEVESPTIGRCRSCGRSCAPWFPLCDRCVGIAARS